MDLKNDCERNYIKEAFDKFYNRVMPYIDLTQFADADTAFKELDQKVHSEIYILKKCLSERDRAVEAGITRSKVLQERISDLEKKIHELEEENANLRVTPFDTLEALKKENVDLSPGHEFEFGDEVFVPWSDAPYMYVKTGLLYNTRTKRLVYVGKDQHLKWFGEKFAIV